MLRAFGGEDDEADTMDIVFGACDVGIMVNDDGGDDDGSYGNDGTDRSIEALGSRLPRHNMIVVCCVARIRCVVRTI